MKPPVVATLQQLIAISRPPVWIILPSIFFAAAWFSQGTAYFPVQTLLIALALSFPMSLHGYGLNDIYDLESDKRNPRKKVFLANQHDISSTKRFAHLGGIIVILAATTTLQVVPIFLAIALVAVSYAYSTPPLRLRDTPPLDSIANGFGYFFLPALMGWSLHRPLLELPVDVIAISIAVMGIHSFASIMDYSADKNAGDRTSATVFGKRGAAFICISSMIAFYLLLPHWYAFVGMALGLVVLIYPNERLAKWGTTLFFLSFLVAMVAYYYFLLTHQGNPFWAPGGIFAH